MNSDIKFINNIIKSLAHLQRFYTIQYHYNSRVLVYQQDKIKLYHYRAQTEHVSDTPVLVVFATVNRPEILDLFPETSFIRGLLDSGQDVYLLDWGYPDAADRNISIADYVTNYIKGCVRFIKEKNQLDKINLLGICQGGLFCLCYTAIYEHIKNLVLISVPIDFHTEDNTVGQLLRRLDTTHLVGNMPGAWLTQFFISLRPFELGGKKYLRYVERIDDPVATEKFLQVEKWLYDAPDQARQAFSELIDDFYKANKLIKSKISLKYHKVDLKKITIPVLNVMAQQDEIVPMSASSVLSHYIGARDYSELIFPSGHIGIYVSDKVGKEMPKAIATWLDERND